jgi:lysophospholipase L1-like esterase
LASRTRPNSGLTIYDHQRFSRRRWLSAAGAVIAAAAVPAGLRAQQATPVAPASTGATPVANGSDWRDGPWVGTWSAAVHTPFPEFGEMPSQLIELDNQTLRQIVRATAGGDVVRVRFANTFGEAPLAVEAARIALRDEGARIDPMTDRELTFNGQTSVTIPAGAMVVSDPVHLTVPALGELTISMHLPEPTATTTVHGFAFQTNFISPAGDFTTETDMPVEASPLSWMFLTGVDVVAPETTGAIVAFGDSITDGAFSTPDTNRRWPDVLAERLVADPPGRAMAVLNQGIGGNRLLNDKAGDLGLAFGQNALARFDRDVLGLPGVTHLIVLEGINDIGLPAGFGVPEQTVTAEEMTGGLNQLAVRARSHDIVPIGGTILPFEGAMYFTPEGEATRQAVNDWIRTSGAFDAVVDFDAVVCDPGHPARLLPDYDSGDHLHPNDAGLRAIGEAVDLSLFRAENSG